MNFSFTWLNEYCYYHNCSSLNCPMFAPTHARRYPCQSSTANATVSYIVNDAVVHSMLNMHQTANAAITFYDF